MQRHIHKTEFSFISITVMVLEVAAFFVFIFGALGAVYGTYSGIKTTDFIIIGFGGIVTAFMLLAFAEFLQLLMRIEYNTRKADILLAKKVKTVGRKKITTRKRKTVRKKK